MFGEEVIEQESTKGKGQLAMVDEWNQCTSLEFCDIRNAMQLCVAKLSARTSDRCGNTPSQTGLPFFSSPFPSP